jgi:hypothetical protein
MKTFSGYLHLSTVIAFIVLFVSCSTIRPSGTDSGGPGLEDEETAAEEDMEALEQLLTQYRSSLADINETSDELEISPIFTQNPAEGSEVSNPYQGFRVQLISTRNVETADSVAAEFEEWAREEVPQYQAPTYVFFKQPYYRVHVGDFQSRSHAVGFTQLVKKGYPEAWMVPDRIDPSNVPPDSVSFAPEDSTEINIMDDN